MALTLGDNFSYQGAKPLDARLNYSTVAAMKAVADATMYNGCIAYCTEADKTYQWKSTNTVDETTGKWREYNPGGGGGGGTSYTAGDGIDITNDVISTEKSEEGAIDEIIDRYPTAGELVSIANAFNKGDLYSADERMIGQWIDGKPLYQKTFSGTVESKTNYTTHDLGITGGIDTIVNVSGVMDNNKPMIAISNDAFTASIAFYIYPNDFSTASRRNTYECFAKPDSNQTYVGHTFIFHLQYTKASDQAVSIGEANEYSTTEKIIGTWTDGSPVCQAVVQFTPKVANGNTWYETDADVSGLNIGFMILSPVMSVKGSYPAICEVHTNGKLRFMHFRGSDSPTIKGAILQYVKSTT